MTLKSQRGRSAISEMFMQPTLKEETLMVGFSKRKRGKKTMQCCWRNGVHRQRPPAKFVLLLRFYLVLNRNNKYNSFVRVLNLVFVSSVLYLAMKFQLVLLTFLLLFFSKLLLPTRDMTL